MFITKKGLEELIQKRLAEQEREYQKNRDLDYSFRRIAEEHERLAIRVAKLEQEVWKPTPTTDEKVERTWMGI